MKRGATIDATGNYRYSLWRQWDASAACLGFVMLNPSRADAEVDDPTIRRCLGFARRWGYGSLEVVNLFAYRHKDPSSLSQVTDPIGPANDDYLLTIGDRVEQMILAWGNRGNLYQRAQVVLPVLLASGRAYCLGLTRSGQPLHPLYLRCDRVPIRFAN